MIPLSRQFRHRPSPAAWHATFLAMVPTIVRYARAAFRDRDPETREDLIQEVVANCLVAFVRLIERGKQDVAYPTVLAMYAVRQIKDGRRVGKKTNVRDVYDQHAQVNGGFQIKHLGSPHEQLGGWKEQLVENNRTPVPDQAAFRIDFPEWLNSLSARDRKMTMQLASGERTGTVAKRFRVSASRVSQLRRQLHESWNEFTAEPDALAIAAAAA
jgi:RNA polymerase sigma factor (sigma-70 family)